jgi:hypothetical protein
VRDWAAQFAAYHLGGRSLPDDLRRLLSLQRDQAASGRATCLDRLGITFLACDRRPALIDAECRGRDGLQGIARLAHAQAMADMVRYSGFVAQDDDGNAIGYWFGPDQVEIESAPLMRFDTTGHFSILRGNSFAEAILALGSQGNDSVFRELRDCLNQQGLAITGQSVHDLSQSKRALDPQVTYQRLIEGYLTDMSATSVPDAGEPVSIMTTQRGPQIPDGD